jgi:hypothetical protein
MKVSDGNLDVGIGFEVQSRRAASTREKTARILRLREVI